MIDEKEGKKKSLFSEKKFFIIPIVLFLVLLLFIIVYIPEFKKLEENFVCGDGSSYGECSLRKPYFCEDGVLIERASICGCSDRSIANTGDSCFSEFQTSGKNITLKYIIRGKEGMINLEVYEGMSNYVSELPRSIHYEGLEQPSRGDFKLRNINEEEQRELLLPLVTKIQNLAKEKREQARIAISLVQEIEFGSSEKLVSGFNQEIDYSRYPYEVLYEEEGVCGEKSELLAFLLREIGYEVVFFYYNLENHEAVGIKCPIEYSVHKTGYCFVETSAPSIMTNDELIYVGGEKLYSKPEVILISKGMSLGNDLYEYKDAKKIKILNNNINEKGNLNIFEIIKLKKLKRKYGLDKSYNI